MTRIETLVRRNEHALELLQRLLALIDGYQRGMPGYPIFMQLNRLYGVLRVHFVQQEIGLYAELAGSSDRDVARTVKSFAGEMNDLAGELECFARHWSSSASISSGFDEFRDAAHQMVLKLAVWFEREAQILFPLAELPQRVAA